MTTQNDLMRHLLVDLPDEDRQHIIDVVDENHANQLRRKRQSASDEAEARAGDATREGPPSQR